MCGRNFVVRWSGTSGAVLTYLTVSLAFWCTGLIPDLAAARDRATKRGWQIFFGVTSLGLARVGCALAAVVAKPTGSRRGWRFPWWFPFTAKSRCCLLRDKSPVGIRRSFRLILCWVRHSPGSAVVVIIAISLRSWFGLNNLVTDDHVDLLGMVLLAEEAGLMTAYGYRIPEVFDALYSRRRP